MARATPFVLIFTFAFMRVQSAAAFAFDPNLKTQPAADETQEQKAKELRERTVTACTDAMNAYMANEKKSYQEAASVACQKLPVCVELLGLDCSQKPNPEPQNWPVPKPAPTPDPQPDPTPTPAALIQAPPRQTCTPSTILAAAQA